MDHAAGADIQMPDFAVAHLPIRQPDIRPRSMDQRIRKVAKQAIVSRLVRRRDRVAFDGRGESPAIENRQNQRFRACHY